MKRPACVCPHCDRIIWQMAPHMKRVRDFARRGRRLRNGVTTREVANHFALSVQNASNTLGRLVALGIMERGGPINLRNGGREFRFYIVHSLRDPV